MTPDGDVWFSDCSFCFTGQLADLKRTQAERQVRSRWGLTTSRVNDRLDYLVVGSIPSTGWRFGSYGRKIETALDIAEQNGGRPRLLPEGDFMAALAEVPPHNSGDIDAKIVVINYRFITPNRDAYNAAALEAMLGELRRSCMGPGSLDTMLNSFTPPPPPERS